MTPLQKLKTKIKTHVELDNLISILVKRIELQDPISTNPMMDGLAIGMLSKTNKFVLCYLQDVDMGRVLDGTISELKLAMNWLDSNEDKICSLLE